VKFFSRGIAVGKRCSYAVTGYGAGAWRPGGVSLLWAWVSPRSIGKPHFLQMKKIVVFIEDYCEACRQGREAGLQNPGLTACPENRETGTAYQAADILRRKHSCLPKIG